MIYMIDSANAEEIKKINDYFPISGVTTNPSLIAQNAEDLKTVITNIRNVIGYEKMLHVQVISTKFEDIVAEAKRLRDFAGQNTYIKIPVTADGIKAIKYLKGLGFKITATAIFTPQQALIAAHAGADFVAPYVNRLDNISSDGAEVAADIADLFRKQHIYSEVLAASFVNLEQIHKTTMRGVTAITISPNLFDKLVYHPLTDIAIKDFIDKGQEYYNI